MVSKRFIVVFLFAFLSATKAYAQESDINKLLDLLTEKGTVSKEEAYKFKEEMAQKKREEKQPPIVGAGSDGFFIKSANGDFALKFRGLVNLDGRFYTESNDQSPASDQFLLRRARGYFEGTIYKYFDFRVMPEFGQGSATLYDAYTEITYFPQAKLKLGRFVTPVSLGFLQPDPDGNFVERSLVTNLLPFRDIGVQLSGDLEGGTINYAVGIFNGAVDGSNSDGDTNDNKEIDGRIFLQPFKQSKISSLEGLGLGISATYGNPKGSSSSTNLPTSLKTQSQERFFNYTTGVVAKGRHQRLSPQAYYYWGPFGLLGEYAASSQGVSLNGREERLNHKAWQVSTSYFLTGEKNAFKGGIKPQREWGALEAAARMARLDIDKDTFPTYAGATSSAQRVMEYTVGVNWYYNRNIRFMIDYGQAKFKGGNVRSMDRNDEKIIQTRWQLLF